MRNLAFGTNLTFEKCMNLRSMQRATKDYSCCRIDGFGLNSWHNRDRGGSSFFGVSSWYIFLVPCAHWPPSRQPPLR